MVKMGEGQDTPSAHRRYSKIDDGIDGVQRPPSPERRLQALDEQHRRLFPEKYDPVTGERIME